MLFITYYKTSSDKGVLGCEIHYNIFLQKVLVEIIKIVNFYFILLNFTFYQHLPVKLFNIFY